MSGTNTSEVAAKRFELAYSVRWNLFLITSGALLCAFAMKSIAVPQQFIPGGFFGVGALIYYKTGWLTPGILFFLINLPAFALGWYKLSPRFVLYSLYGMVAMTVAYEVMNIHVEIHDQFYAAVACGVLNGLGGGLILRSLGSGGGLDILAVYLFKTTISAWARSISGSTSSCSCSAFQACPPILSSYPSSWSSSPRPWWSRPWPSSPSARSCSSSPIIPKPSARPSSIP